MIPIGTKGRKKLMLAPCLRCSPIITATERANASTQRSWTSDAATGGGVGRVSAGGSPAAFALARRRYRSVIAAQSKNSGMVPMTKPAPSPSFRTSSGCVAGTSIR